MEEKDILNLLEVQYIKGRLDEISLKAIPGVTSLHKSRLLDVRLGKYLEKLKNTNESAYYLYLVESENRRYAKAKGKENIKKLLLEVLQVINNPESALHQEIQKQLNKY